LSSLHQIHILRHLNHPCVVKLLDLLPPSNPDEPSDVYLVFEYMEHDLIYVRDAKNPATGRQFNVEDDHTRWMMYRILMALQHCKHANVVHRDIKSANVLVNLAECDIRVRRLAHCILVREYTT
jgi:mitogen-activated protein kinase 1/3